MTKVNVKTRLKSSRSSELIRKKDELVAHYIDTNAPDLLESYTRLLDDYFHEVIAESLVARKMTLSGNPAALIALGGYGRGEQCVHSDVDLLILFEKKIPDTTDALVQELVYPLWDARLETGYAVRTIKECLSMAWDQFDILTTLLDARFICGASQIFSNLMETFRTRLSKKYIQSSLNRLIEHSQRRYQDFGDSTYLLEPNLKSGHGGLRDYHTILWYARIMADIKSRKDLERNGFLSHDEYTTLETSLDAIWYIRNQLHYITGRKCDQLHFEHQLEVADRLNFKGKDRHQMVERFMGDLHAKMDYIKQINLMLTEDIQLTKKARYFIFKPKPTHYEGIVVRQRRLEFSSMEMVPKQPDLLLKIFVESGRLQTPLSIEARRIIGEFVGLVNHQFRKEPANVEAFEKILASSLWEFNVLNVMLTTGLLAKFIPEFGSIINKIQYNQYHLFPVDKHSIRCVQVLNSFRGKRVDPAHEFYATIYRELKRRKILLMAGLLHDIGKGDPNQEHSERGAEIARKIMTRSGYSEADIKEAVFLVQHHLFLAKVATRRDITDEETALFCARTIKRIGRLRKLFLLTVADSMATGPKAWNEWTQVLLRDLFLKTAGIIKNRELAAWKSSRIINEKRDKVLELIANTPHVRPPDTKKSARRRSIDSNVSDSQNFHLIGCEKEALLKVLDALNHRYLMSVTPHEIVTHLSLYHQYQERGDDFLWNIQTEEASDIRTVTICGKDRPGFYSKVAGAFFLNGLNIVGSQAYTLIDDCALDIFKVMPPKDRVFEDKKWEKAKQALHNALADDAYLEHLNENVPRRIAPISGGAVKQNEVRIDNDTSNFFTVIEVFTYDFPGLLFVVTDTLYRLGLDVRVAMVATKVDQVVDVFYVKYADDGKIDDSEDEVRVRDAILHALPPVEIEPV